MARSRRTDTAPVADRPADVTVSQPDLLAEGYRNFERYRLTYAAADGRRVSHVRDVLRAGRVVSVLPVDPKCGEVVLLRQFRLPAHLATGKGEMIEIVAGYAEAGEDLMEAARRECAEEIGVLPRRLVELLSFMPAPGSTDERGTLFLAEVDATAVPAQGGSPDEDEIIEPMRIGIDAALATLAQGAVHNGYLVIALQWLALNRDRLGDILGGGSTRGK